MKWTNYDPEFFFTMIKEGGMETWNHLWLIRHNAGRVPVADKVKVIGRDGYGNMCVVAEGGAMWEEDDPCLICFVDGENA